MSLIDNLKIAFPQTPNPPNVKIKEISDALDFAIQVHILGAFSGIGFGATFLSKINTPTPFLISLASYFEAMVSPIITAALTASLIPGSNRILAWVSVQPSFDAIIASPPPIFLGVAGPAFWAVIVLTIRLSISLSINNTNNNEQNNNNDVIIENEI